MTEPTESDTCSLDGWLDDLRAYVERQERTRKLRAELQAAREAGKRLRHARRLAQAKDKP